MEHKCAERRSLKACGAVSLAALLAGLGLCAWNSAEAAEAAEADEPAWQLRWGGAVASWPRFPGADKSRLMVLPLFEAQHRKGFFASSLRGVGWEFRLGELGRISVAGGFDARERRSKDDPRAKLLGEHKMRPALLVAADLQLGPAYLELNAVDRLRTRSREIDTGFGKYVSHYKEHGDGATVDLEVGLGLMRSERVQLRGGLRMAAMDSRFARNFYSVPAEVGKAMTPPLKPFQAGSGAMSAGLGLQAQVQLDKDWHFSARMMLDQLRGDAAASPLTQQRKQPSLMMSFSRAL
ncbi:MipA/OmpV family protein [Pelomonas sp. V22]|uniref:MipA/OmpV family protein n=1 Tax=Pelomonas sp. V22 TaxID=2822139 RepID=UPI0024A7B0F9|nr:MipA/OmpV family protein [Pelomonas sp. V22]MDI4632819.1 MipA/OmpV family protein [Pelomonas sp. V22]